jgi:hypothetical protein
MIPLTPIPFYTWSPELVLRNADAAPNANPYLLPGLQLDRVGPEDADGPPDAHPYLLPGLQLDRVGPEDADDPPDAHPYLLPGLQLDRVGPENADDPPICYLVSSLRELVLRMPMTRLSVTWSPA